MFAIMQMPDSTDGNVRVMVMLHNAGLICEYRPDGWDAVGIVRANGSIAPIPLCFRLREDIRAELDLYTVEG